jgi:hypothetical protein
MSYEVGAAGIPDAGNMNNTVVVTAVACSIGNTATPTPDKSVTEFITSTYIDITAAGNLAVNITIHINVSACTFITYIITSNFNFTANITITDTTTTTNTSITTTTTITTTGTTRDITSATTTTLTTTTTANTTTTTTTTTTNPNPN